MSVIDFAKAKRDRELKKNKSTKAKIMEALEKFGSQGGAKSLEKMKKLFKRDEDDNNKTD